MMDNNDIEIQEDNLPKTPPKKPKVRRLCTYNEEWEKKYDWVTKCSTDDTLAQCKLCNTIFSIAYDGVNGVTSHSNSKKHNQAREAAATSKRMQAFFTVQGTPLSDKVTAAELVQVYHGVKHHFSYLAQDCSMKVLKTVVDDSEVVKKMSVGRTKATALVNMVLHPFAVESVLKKLKGGPHAVSFSVSTDASNKGNRKFFPVCAKYFTVEDGLVSSILDFYEDSFEDSLSVKNHLCKVLHDAGLSWENVSAYGADNTSVNFGINKSVYKRLLLDENSDIIAAHCNNHIVHNCAKHALKTMSFDVENIVMKVFAEFSNSAKRRENLKQCFEFFGSQFHEVIRHVPTRWLSLFSAVERLLLNWEPIKSYFLQQGCDECSPAIWAMLSDQEHEMAPEDKPTIYELYLYFVHFFMSDFNALLLLLEKEATTACELYAIMTEFRDSLRNKIVDEFFGMKAKLAVKKDYLADSVKRKFTSEALRVYQRAVDYLEKWFPFDTSPYRHFTALSLGRSTRPPSLDEILTLWMISPLKTTTPPDQLYAEVCALSKVFNDLQGNTTVEKWCSFFRNEQAPNLLRLVQYILSIPVSNASVERVFSVMGNVWNDERNRMAVETVRSELCIFFNLSFSCTEFRDIVVKNKQLIKLRRVIVSIKEKAHDKLP